MTIVGVTMHMVVDVEHTIKAYLKNVGSGDGRIERTDNANLKAELSLVPGTFTGIPANLISGVTASTGTYRAATDDCEFEFTRIKFMEAAIDDVGKMKIVARLMNVAAVNHPVLAKALLAILLSFHRTGKLKGEYCQPESTFWGWFDACSMSTEAVGCFCLISSGNSRGTSRTRSESRKM